MKRFPTLLGVPLLALSAAAAGCATNQTAGMAGAPGDAAAAPAAGTTAQGIAYRGDFRGPLGLQLWSVRNSMKDDVPGTLKRVHDWGFREVETAGTYGLTAAQFRQELDRAGLRATSMHVGYELLRDSMESVLQQARTLGVQYVGTAWIPHQGPFTEEMARKTANDFNRFGQAARAQGLQFFYHTHGFEFQPAANGIIPFDILVKETDPNNVKYEMDVFWVTRPGQDPVALLKKYPNRWKLMHIKDMKPGTPTNDFSGGAPAEAEVAIGQGMIDYRGVLQTAHQIGLVRYFVEDETTDPLANIPQSVQWLSTVQYRN